MSEEDRSDPVLIELNISLVANSVDKSLGVFCHQGCLAGRIAPYSPITDELWANSTSGDQWSIEDGDNGPFTKREAALLVVTRYLFGVIAKAKSTLSGYRP
jgi:hypothetical protein